MLCLKCVANRDRRSTETVVNRAPNRSRPILTCTAVCNIVTVCRDHDLGWSRGVRCTAVVLVLQYGVYHHDTCIMMYTRVLGLNQSTRPYGRVRMSGLSGLSSKYYCDILSITHDEVLSKQKAQRLCNRLWTLPVP